MKRIVNARLPVITALTLAAGTFTGCLFSYFNIDIIWTLAIIPLSAVFILIFAFIKKSQKILIIITIITGILLLGLLNCYFRIENYKSTDIDESQIYTITGEVIEKRQTADSEYLIIKAYSNGHKLNGKLKVNLGNKYGDYCDIGYKIKFQSYLTSLDAFTYGKLNYNTINNIKYQCTVNGGLTAEYGFSLTGTIRSAIRDTLYKNLDTDTASVCYAMLTGNTDDIDESVLNNFRFGGIAHIFAVSGLHIGIIFMLINFICKKAGLNKYLSAVLCIGLTLFYSAVCGFSLSSVRAVIMCASGIIAQLIYAKNDVLNFLAFAVLIILVIAPLSLFTVGFQLSVCAVGGIAVWSHNVTSGFEKLKIPKRISSAAGVSLGAQIGTLPVMLSNFGYLSAAGLLLNIIIIPVFSILFIILFFGTLLSIIIPPAAPFFLSVSAVPLETVLSFLLSINFEKALITGFGTGLFVPFYFIGALSLSDKIKLKIPARVISAICTSILLAGYVLIQTYAPFGGYKIIVSSQGGNKVIIKSREGTVLVLSEGDNSKQTVTALSKYYSARPDGIIILGGENCIETYSPDYNCTNVYICKLYINVQPYNDIKINYEKNFDLCGINFEFTDGYSLKADIGGINTLICSATNQSEVNCDLLISKYYNDKYFAKCSVYFNLKDYKFNLYDYGDLTFYAKDSTLRLTGIVPNRICTH